MSMINELRQQVLGIVQKEGPVLPVQVTRHIGRDTMFVGAVLSELVASKAVRISHAKIGGSPVYYVEGQEPKLSKLYDSLPMREKEAYRLLEQKKFVKDSEAPPAIRVAFRSIKDFAVPVQVQNSQGEEIVWRWYLTPKEEYLAHVIPVREEKNVIEQQASLVREHVQQNLVSRQEKKTGPQKREDVFASQVAEYLVKQNVRVVSQQSLKKNKEAQFVISVPSALGELEWCAAALNKKRVSDADVILARQKSKLPTLFLTTGELTKKAKEYVEKNLKGHFVHRRI